MASGRQREGERDKTERDKTGRGRKDVKTQEKSLRKRVSGFENEVGRVLYSGGSCCVVKPASGAQTSSQH